MRHRICWHSHHPVKSDRLLSPRTNASLRIEMCARGSIAGLTQEKPKTQTIDATAMGTSTQLGETVQVTLYIYDYSTEDDKQILIEASEKGKNQGWSTRW
jgi:hypothetical protein